MGVKFTKCEIYGSTQLCVSLPLFGCRYVANFDEMYGHALGYLITHEGLLCHRDPLTIIVY